MAYLELDRVAKQFGAQTVVDDFSLSVGKGEFISFLGPSGCGKTTTLQMIAGFLDPTRGAIRLEGKDLTAVHPAKRGLGIVFQSYALFPHMTAAENVAFGLEMRNMPRAERAERVRAAVIQVLADDDAPRSIARAGELVQAAAVAGAGVIVLPERWNWWGRADRRREGLEAIDGPALSAARAWARELGVAMVAGSVTLTKDPLRWGVVQALRACKTGDDASGYMVVLVKELQLGLNQVLGG